MQEKLQKQTEQTQKLLEQHQEWKVLYDSQANLMLENKHLIEEFYKVTKEYESPMLQFHITEILSTPPNIFAITIKYLGQPIATVTLSKDKTIITTEKYTESNRKYFNCSIQLKDEEYTSIKSKQFLNYFCQDIEMNTKGNERARIENMLLAEFAKTSSYTKKLTGIQPIKFSKLYYPIPVITSAKTTEPIPILTRSKVRKITIVELMDETQEQEQETVLANATKKAVFLTNLLHSEHGAEWYKIIGFSGRVPTTITIKVVIAANKKLSNKCKEFKPFSIQNNIDTLEYHCLYYEESKNEITKIQTTLND